MLLALAMGQVFVLSFNESWSNAGATLSTGIMFGFFYYRYFFKFSMEEINCYSWMFNSIILVILFLGQLNGKELHVYAFCCYKVISSISMMMIKRKLDELENFQV
ncbi:hypothetical protein KHA80_08715 [Anaerobacillus sp. HL2]|nr:hypothetical protein KHA80_08715 [Anaerobacillus sp. HL2]